MSASAPRVAVLGATGRTGSHVVAQLRVRADPRFVVRAVVRPGTEAAALRAPDGANASPERLDCVAADIREIDALRAALRGCTHAICAVGTNRDFHGDNRPERVDFEGVLHLAAVARELALEQVVLVSARGVTQPDHPLNAQANGLLSWKLRGEDALRASGVPYTIVRPGGLDDVALGTRGVRVGRGDVLPFGWVPRAEVAAACVAALGSVGARGLTFEMIGDDSEPVADWNAIYRRLGTG